MISFGYNYQALRRHAIHPYPAKFPASLPYQIINEYLSSSSSKVIFDPFSGCGTTILEGINCGHHVIGNDTNHIGNLITRVKTENYTPLSFKKMDKVCEQLMNKLDRNKIRITRDFHGRDHCQVRYSALYHHACRHVLFARCVLPDQSGFRSD